MDIYPYSQKSTLLLARLPLELIVHCDKFVRANDPWWRLCSLLPIYDPAFLEKLNQKAVIAGGSVVYACCPDLKRNYVGDIDFFVLNEDKDTFVELLLEVRDWAQKNSLSVKFCTREPHHPEDKDFSVVSAKFEMFTLQFVFSGKTSPLEVIQGFDMDYVQCSYFKGKLLRTEPCLKAHQTRTISQIYHTLVPKRIIKAWKKGFRVPPLFLSVPPPPGHDPYTVPVKINALRIESLRDIPMYFSSKKLSDEDLNTLQVWSWGDWRCSTQGNTFRLRGFLNGSGTFSLFGIKVNVKTQFMEDTMIPLRSDWKNCKILLDEECPWYPYFPEMNCSSWRCTVPEGEQLLIVEFVEYLRSGPPYEFYCRVHKALPYHKYGYLQNDVFPEKTLGRILTTPKNETNRGDESD